MRAWGELYSGGRVGGSTCCNPKEKSLLITASVVRSTVLCIFIDFIPLDPTIPPRMGKAAVLSPLMGRLRSRVWVST